MNDLPKYVVTTTLKTGEWKNSHLIKENIPKEISKLKELPGRDFLVAGSATLVQTLIKHDLVDEYHLLIYPVMVGKGKRLFKDGMDKVALKLVHSRTSASGVLLVTYQPDRKEMSKGNSA